MSLTADTMQLIQISIPLQGCSGSTNSINVSWRSALVFSWRRTVTVVVWTCNARTHQIIVSLSDFFFRTLPPSRRSRYCAYFSTSRRYGCSLCKVFSQFLRFLPHLRFTDIAIKNKVQYCIVIKNNFYGTPFVIAHPLTCNFDKDGNRTL